MYFSLNSKEALRNIFSNSFVESLNLMKYTKKGRRQTSNNVGGNSSSTHESFFRFFLLIRSSLISVFTYFICVIWNLTLRKVFCVTWKLCSTEFSFLQKYLPTNHSKKNFGTCLPAYEIAGRKKKLFFRYKFILAKHEIKFFRFVFLEFSMILICLLTIPKLYRWLKQSFSKLHRSVNSFQIQLTIRFRDLHIN